MPKPAETGRSSGLKPPPAAASASSIDGELLLLLILHLQLQAQPRFKPIVHVPVPCLPHSPPPAAGLVM